MNKRLLGLTIATAAVVGLAAIEANAAPAPTPAAPAPAAPVVVPQAPPGFSKQYVTEVQYVLKSYGYTIIVDGIYGPQTTRVVQSWQRANGLLTDGIAGPVTRRSLGLDGAVRQSNTPKTVTAPPSAPSGSVEDMIRAIWPDDLENQALRIAYRESRYQPGVTSSTGCCHGVFQIHEVHFGWMRAHGVTSVSQLFNAETNIRMAYELYKRNGWAPWAATL